MNEDFGAITILAPKCQKCPKVKSCDHKRMAHLGYIIPIESIRVSEKLNFQKQYFEAIKKERYL